MARYAVKFKRIAHVGNSVSHAKNRTKRSFKRNLHSVTVMVGGKKQKMLVPVKVLRMMKRESKEASVGKEAVATAKA